jgi:hypothetical protein
MRNAAKVDSEAAVALWNLGFNLRQIQAATAPGATRMSVYRAIKRARKNGSMAREFVQCTADGTPARKPTRKRKAA